MTSQLEQFDPEKLHVKPRKTLKGCALFTNTYVAIADKVSVISLVKLEHKSEELLMQLCDDMKRQAKA